MILAPASQAQFRSCRIDSVALIVAGAIGNKSYQTAARFIPRHKLVENFTDRVDDLEISPLAAPADIVAMSGTPLGENQRECSDVVINIEPVTDMPAVSVHRQRLSFDRIQDYQRNKLFWELIRTKIIGAIADYGWEPVGRVPGAREMIARGLAGGIGRTRIISRMLGKMAGGTERTIDLIGRDMQKAESRLLVCRQARPIGASRLKQNVSPHHVCSNEIGGAGDRAINMARGCKMQHAVRREFVENVFEYLPIADVRPHEAVGRQRTYCVERMQIGRVSQFVDVQDVPAFV